jgi:15-cis-phytoene synthase
VNAVSIAMSSELAASHAFCARVARAQARNFYPSFRLLPAARRRSMCALYAYMRQSDDIADLPGPAEDKRRALDAWRTALNHALGGQPTTDAWPGWLALADAVARHGIPARYLREVIDGVAMDLEPRGFATFDELAIYCYRVASVVGLCCLHIWGYRSENGRAEKLAEACGIALQLTNILRDVREDALNGRVYLPQDEMDRFGVDREALGAATAGAALRRLLAFEAQRAYDEYERGRALVALVDPAGQPMLRAITGIYRALLDEIAHREYDVLRDRARVPSWRKAWIVLRSYAGRDPSELPRRPTV